MVIEANKIKSELAKVGVIINDIYDLVNTNTPYPAAVPILLNLLQNGIEDISIKEGVIRALAVKEAVGKANLVLLDEYDKTPKDKMLLRWAIGNTIYTTITKDYIERILSIVQDKENGISRQMFVSAIGKVRSEEVEDVLISLLSDDDVVAQALDALSRMKSKKAKKNISLLMNHPKSFVRKEAQKALNKIV